MEKRDGELKGRVEVEEGGGFLQEYGINYYMCYS